jgi:GT2 family glycosyltransferase
MRGWLPHPQGRGTSGDSSAAPRCGRQTGEYICGKCEEIVMEEERQMEPHRAVEWPKVAIIVLNWNNYAATSRCLESLADITYPNYLIYLIDNNSHDGSKEMLYEKFNDSEVRFIFNEKNLGFSAGCNEGISKALQDDCDYILLLNNDCIAYKKDFLVQGVKLAESNSHYGIIGGKILFWPDTKRIWSTGGYITILGGERYIGYGEIDEGQYDEIAERHFISGALMLIKREVLRQIGLLPEIYFFGKEDWEFSNLARSKGYLLLYDPKFSIYHEASSSHEWTDPVYIYNGALSKILYWRRNSPRALFRIWFTMYRLYLEYFFDLKYHLMGRRFLQGVPSNVLRIAMLDAVMDAPQIDKISEETLICFRQRHLSMQERSPILKQM